MKRLSTWLLEALQIKYQPVFCREHPDDFPFCIRGQTTEFPTLILQLLLALETLPHADIRSLAKQVRQDTEEAYARAQAENTRMDYEVYTVLRELTHVVLYTNGREVIVSDAQGWRVARCRAIVRQKACSPHVAALIDAWGVCITITLTFDIRCVDDDHHQGAYYAGELVAAASFSGVSSILPKLQLVTGGALAAYAIDAAVSLYHFNDKEGSLDRLPPVPAFPENFEPLQMDEEVKLLFEPTGDAFVDELHERVRDKLLLGYTITSTACKTPAQGYTSKGDKVQYCVTTFESFYEPMVPRLSSERIQDYLVGVRAFQSRSLDDAEITEAQVRDIFEKAWNIRTFRDIVGYTYSNLASLVDSASENDAIYIVNVADHTRTSDRLLGALGYVMLRRIIRDKSRTIHLLGLDINVLQNDIGGLASKARELGFVPGVNTLHGVYIDDGSYGGTQLTTETYLSVFKSMNVGRSVSFDDDTNGDYWSEVLGTHYKNLGTELLEHFQGKVELHLSLGVLAEKAEAMALEHIPGVHLMVGERLSDVGSVLSEHPDLLRVAERIGMKLDRPLITLDYKQPDGLSTSYSVLRSVLEREPKPFYKTREEPPRDDDRTSHLSVGVGVGIVSLVGGVFNALKTRMSAGLLVAEDPDTWV